MKRMVLAVVAVFVAWGVMDFVLHGVVLGPTYAATASLWRPMAEMKMGLMYAVTLTVAACFVLSYGWLVGRKSVARGVMFGTLFGLASGMSMGWGTYCVMPIPLNLAVSWMVGTLIEGIVAGVIVGVVVKGAVVSG